MTADRWTWQQDRNLRRWYPLYPVKVTARLLGMPTDRVRNRARRLGLSRGYFRPWTGDGPRLREWYMAGVEYVEIARRLGRPVRQVYKQARVMGLPPRGKHTRATPEVLGLLAAVMGDGRCDSCAADAAGCDRHMAAYWRRKLGLPPNPGNGCPCVRLRAAEQMRRQCASLGLPVGYYRTYCHALKAMAAGWPADLGPRHVQILDLLYGRGPHTRKEIAAALGMPWKGSRASLTSNDPEGSYLAHLMARGLVVRIGRRQRGRQYEYVYATPLGVERGAVS